MLTFALAWLCGTILRAQRDPDFITPKSVATIAMLNGQRIDGRIDGVIERLKQLESMQISERLVKLELLSEQSVKSADTTRGLLTGVMIGLAVMVISALFDMWVKMRAVLGPKT